MNITLTRKQAQLLDYLERYTVNNKGVSPSFEEMKDALGLKSKSGVHRLVDALVERGRIVRLSNRARSLSVLPDDPFAGIPTHLLIAELARRGETNAEARRLA